MKKHYLKQKINLWLDELPDSSMVDISLESETGNNGEISGIKWGYSGIIKDNIVRQGDDIK